MMSDDYCFLEFLLLLFFSFSVSTPNLPEYCWQYFGCKHIYFVIIYLLQFCCLHLHPVERNNMLTNYCACRRQWAILKRHFFYVRCPIEEQLYFTLIYCVVKLEFQHNLECLPLAPHCAMSLHLTSSLLVFHINFYFCCANIPWGSPTKERPACAGLFSETDLLIYLHSFSFPRNVTRFILMMWHQTTMDRTWGKASTVFLSLELWWATPTALLCLVNQTCPPGFSAYEGNS